MFVKDVLQDAAAIGAEIMLAAERSAVALRQAQSTVALWTGRWLPE